MSFTKSKNIKFILLAILIAFQIAYSYQLSGLRSELNAFSNALKVTKTSIEMDELSTRGTEGYYLSPHGLIKQSKVSQALLKIESQFKIQRTQYNHSQSTYVLQNFTIQLDYDDRNQKVEINDRDEVSATGGTVYFGYRFNYSVTNNNRSVKGWGRGSVHSDSLSYKKILTINYDGYLQWRLAKIDGFHNLTIHNNRMKIKRIQPFNQKDLDVLEEMMDKVFQNIHPSNIQHQLLENFNTLFPPALNDSLNDQILDRKIDYVYHHPIKGQLNMTIIHYIWEFGINKVDGYKIIYVTEIEGHEKETTCNITVPYEHFSFDLYGGIQSIHLNCLYQDVVDYIQAQGWLDTQMNSDWEVNAFHFYAEDLFDVIGSLQAKVNPRSILQGQCKASKNNLVLKSAREFDINTYSLNIEYNCSIKTTAKTGETLDILQFIAETKFYIKVYADKLTINFQIQKTQIIQLSFTLVNNFIVTDIQLALLKAQEVLKKNIKTKVFGTGFRSLPREIPITKVDKDWVIYYDASAINSTKNSKQFIAI